jgi:hypothetical protein
MSLDIFLKGDKELQDLFNSLDKNIRDSALQAAARKGARPVINSARRNIDVMVKGYKTNSQGRYSKGFNKDMQSKASYIKRNIVSQTPNKRYGIGVNVLVKGKDIPVGDRYWWIGGYATLLAFGSYQQPGFNRKTRGKGFFIKTGKKNRGRFKGIGNFMDQAAKSDGDLALSIMKEHMRNEVNRALDRSIKRLQKVR